MTKISTIANKRSSEDNLLGPLKEKTASSIGADEYSRLSGEYFNSQYAEEEFYWGEQPNLLVPLVSSHLEPGSRVLVIGCGEGRDALFLARFGFDVIATDIASNGLEKAGRLAEGNGCKLQLINLDAHRSHDHLGVFDGLLSMNVIQLLNPDMITGRLAYFQSRVRSGGIVAIQVFTVDDPNYQDWLKSGIPPRGSLTFEHPTRGYPIRFFAKGELASHFEGWEFIHYYEGLLWDKPHGIQSGFHQHGFAQIIARKKSDTWS